MDMFGMNLFNGPCYIKFEYTEMNGNPGVNYTGNGGPSADMLLMMGICSYMKSNSSSLEIGYEKLYRFVEATKAMYKCLSIPGAATSISMDAETIMRAMEGNGDKGGT